MVKIQDRLKGLLPYVQAVKFTEDGYVFIEMLIKIGWVINPTDDITVNLVAGTTNKYIIYNGNKEKTIDDLFDFSESVISFNMEIELKQALLESKVKYLKELFSTLDLETAKNVRIEVMDGDTEKTDESSL